MREEQAWKPHARHEVHLVHLAADGGPLAVANLLEGGKELGVLAPVLHGQA